MGTKYSQVFQKIYIPSTRILHLLNDTSYVEFDSARECKRWIWVGCKLDNAVCLFCFDVKRCLHDQSRAREKLSGQIHPVSDRWLACRMQRKKAKLDLLRASPEETPVKCQWLSLIEFGFRVSRDGVYPFRIKIHYARKSIDENSMERKPVDENSIKPCCRSKKERLMSIR